MVFFTDTMKAVMKNIRKFSFVSSDPLKKALFSEKAFFLKSAAFLGILFLMVSASCLVGESEIIFPEIGAIATGMFLAPRFAWRADYRRIFLCLLLCGILGMAIVRFVPGPAALQMSLGYVLALLVLMISGTTFAPMVSALVLPVLLQTKSVWYLISLVTFTLLLIGTRKTFEHLGMVKQVDFKAASPEETTSVPLTIFRAAVASVMIAAALSTGWTFMAAPPILVLFTELTAPGSRALEHPARGILLMTLCAMAGAWVRLGVNSLSSGAAWALPLSVVLSGVLFLLILYRMQLFLPPAGAALLLAYLAPEKALTLYPVEILAGVSLYFAAAVLYRNAVAASEERPVSVEGNRTSDG